LETKGRPSWINQQRPACLISSFLSFFLRTNAHQAFLRFFVQIPFSSTPPTQLLLAFCGQASIKQKKQGSCNSGQEMMSAQQKNTRRLRKLKSRPERRQIWPNPKRLLSNHRGFGRFFEFLKNRQFSPAPVLRRSHSGFLMCLF
jgi:hypothetical protein